VGSGGREQRRAGGGGGVSPPGPAGAASAAHPRLLHRRGRCAGTGAPRPRTTASPPRRGPARRGRGKREGAGGARGNDAIREKPRDGDPIIEKARRQTRARGRRLAGRGTRWRWGFFPVGLGPGGLGPVLYQVGQPV
jgi:hypothetical protein